VHAHIRTKSNLTMHKENIHEQSHKRQENTVVNVVHPTLGYVHNEWLLYYSFCNRLRLCTCAYNRYIKISLSPSFLASLQCKPLSTTLFLHSDIDSFSSSYSITLLTKQSLNIEQRTSTDQTNRREPLIFPTHYIFIHKF
jgi:hypothetical protein